MGPLAATRGFDSIVHVATGLAHTVSFDLGMLTQPYLRTIDEPRVGSGRLSPARVRAMTLSVSGWRWPTSLPCGATARLPARRTW